MFVVDTNVLVYAADASAPPNTIGAGNIAHDTQTAVLMHEHGIRRICTRDTDFHRFTFLEPIDPLTAEP